MSTTDEPLNLKEFIADLDLPVIVGGCTDYKTALHLMRTGAAGVIVGVGGDEWSTTESVLGIRVPMATAIADAAAARRDYLDETGGRYVHLIADGDLQTTGDIAKALGCGADAVMLGEPLSLLRGGAGRRAPGGTRRPATRSLPRGAFGRPASRSARLEQLLYGPADEPDGSSTSSAACAGRWPSAATATSRSSRRSAWSWTGSRPGRRRLRLLRPGRRRGLVAGAWSRRWP